LRITPSSIRTVCVAALGGLFLQACVLFALRVQGTVTSLDGSVASSAQPAPPLADVQVVLDERSAHYVGVARTDVDGRFHIDLRYSSQRRKPYTLTFSKPGYGEKIVNLDEPDKTPGVKVKSCGRACRTGDVVLTPLAGS
jgi:hypothetical protein